MAHSYPASEGTRLCEIPLRVSSPDGYGLCEELAAKLAGSEEDCGEMSL